MKRSNIPFMTKQFNSMVNKETIRFDYPIQREGEQWDLLQKSLLIHSMVNDYPIPPIYCLLEKELITNNKGKEKEESVYKVLDGKQRLTNITDFLNNKYPLSPDTPDAVIDDEEYELAEKLFEELDEEVQDSINSYALSFVRIEEATDEEIEDMFFRLNNGTPLSKQQKAKAKMGTEWAIKIKKLVDHKFMQEKTAFTKLQIRKADNEIALLQSMMLLDPEHELKSISSNDVFNYALTFKENNKDEVIAKVIEAIEYLDKVFETKEKVLLKKVHFPMTIITALQAIAEKIEPDVFREWTNSFKDSLKDKEGAIGTHYKEFGGQGSVKKVKTLGRVEAMGKHLSDFLALRQVEEIKEQEDNVEDINNEVNDSEEVAEDIENKEDELTVV